MEGNVQIPGDIYFAYYIDGVASQNAPLQNTEYTLDESAPNTYLTIGNNFWTMTPAGGYNPIGTTNWYAFVFFVNASGHIDDNFTAISRGLRPVLNLRSDVTILGEGTIEKPYTVS